MRESSDGFESEHRAGAFDRMQRTEGTVDQILIVLSVGQVEKRLFEVFQEFLRLLTKQLRRVLPIHAPNTFLTTAINCSCWKGLVIQPVAPAAFASALSWPSDSVVRNRIGTPL